MQCPNHSSRLGPAYRSRPRPDHQPCPPPSPYESHPAIVRHRHANRAPSTGAPPTVRRCMKSALHGKRHRSSAHGMFALRDSARLSPNHPARASCCDALCGLARSLNQALRAQSPRPASQSSPAPRPATANAFASLSPRAKPSRSILPAIRARRRESATIVPPPRVASRAPPALKGSRCSRSISCKGALRRALALPSLGRNMLRASLARWRGLSAPAHRACVSLLCRGTVRGHASLVE